MSGHYLGDKHSKPRGSTPGVEHREGPGARQDAAEPDIHKKLSNRQLVHLGFKIVGSLKELGGDQYQITVPSGVSDIQALDAINKIAIERRNATLIDGATRERLVELFASTNRNTDERRYTVSVLVSGTTGLSHASCLETLESMQLAPADPLAAAIVLLARVYQDNLRSPIGNRILRTKNAEVSLAIELRAAKLVLGDTLLREDQETGMAGEPALPATGRSWSEWACGLRERLLGSLINRCQNPDYSQKK